MAIAKATGIAQLLSTTPQTIVESVGIGMVGENNTVNYIQQRVDETVVGESLLHGILLGWRW